MSEPLVPPPVTASAKDGVTPIDNMRGARWMIAASLCFAVTIVLVKRLGTEFAAPEIAFIRSLFAVTFVVPFLARQGLGAFRTRSPGMHLVRVACVAVGMNLGFYAAIHLPIATASALSFTRPLFMIVLGMLVLGEIVRWRRGVATVVGFAGVIIMLGPTELGSSLPALAALAAAAAAACSVSVVRRQAAIDGPGTVMAWFSVGAAVLCLFPAIPVWETPQTLAQWALLAGVGIMSSLAQYLMINAYIHGEATVLNPIDYSQIILTAIMGYFMFGEVPSLWTWAGAAIIVASTLYILLREQALARTAA